MNQVEEERANDIHLNNEKQKEFNALDASIKVSSSGRPAKTADN